jgi:CheY-like chemotaxis protein
MRSYDELVSRLHELSTTDGQIEKSGRADKYPVFSVRREVAANAPTVLLTGGMHGDQPAGVEAAMGRWRLMKPCEVLLVNDDPQVIAALHRALADVPHRLMVAASTGAALRLLANEHCAFDVVVLDLAIGGSWRLVLHTVQTCCESLPVIAVAAGDDWEQWEDACLYGAVSLLDKPVSTGALAAALPCLRGLGD